MSYRKELEIFGEIESHVKKEVQKLGLRIGQRLAIETPVDEGTARLNWRVGIDKSVDGKLPPPKSPMQASNLSIIAQQKELKKAKAFGLVYIQNNLPYIERLNEGWSMQAESQFVDVIIEQEVNRND